MEATETKLPTGFKTDIVKRMYSPEEFAAFVASYKANKKSVGAQRGMKEPTEEQRQWADMRRDGMTVHQIAEKTGARPSSIDAAIRRVSLWMFLNKQS